MFRLTPLLLIAGLAWLGGCERPADRTEADPASPPAQAAAAVEQPPPPLPTLAYIMVDQNLYEFPRPRLRIQQKDEQAFAMLFSDDPAQRDGESQPENSFYFELMLEGDELERLTEVLWTYRAASSDRADTPNGIFLDGWRQHLQPNDIVIAFEPHPELDDRMVIHLTGQFMLYHTRDRGQAPRWASVDSRLILRPEMAN